MGEVKAKKKKGLNPLILVIIVLIIAMVGILAYFVFIKGASTPGPYVVPEIVEARWTTDEFTVNLADTDVDRYAKLTIALGYDSVDKDLAEELTKEEVVIKDAVISVMMAKKKSELNYVGIDKLKVELIRKFNAILGGNKIIHVYIDSLVIQ